MRRYIDADALLKSTVSKFKCVPLVGVHSYKSGEEYFDGEDFDDLINNTPTADVVEVVRCKDCAYYRKETSYCLNPHCSSSFYGHRVKENHYCSYGERREKNEG